MRFIISTLFALALTSTAASAGDLVSGFSVSTEVKSFRLIDAETNNLTVDPELEYQFSFLPVSLTVGSLITVYETNHASGDDFAVMNIWEDGHKPTLDLAVEYQFIENGQLYGETSWDFNAEDRGDIEIGVAFTF